MIVNRSAPPFDNPDLRRAMALTLDRQAFIDVLSGGQDDIGAAMLLPPEGLWGMPPDRLRALPEYDPDVQKNRGKARELKDLFHRQSRETDQARRKELVWDIDTKLQEERARPVIFHTRGATCWHPRVKGLTTMVNSMVNGWRMEDGWLER